MNVSLFIQHLNSWLPYVNIALIFCVICIYGLGPCEFSVAVRLKSETLQIFFINCFKKNLVKAGVSLALPADLFLQAWRPSAFVISGTVNWLCMFLIGMVFSYIVVRYQLCTTLQIIYTHYLSLYYVAYFI